MRGHRFYRRQFEWIADFELYSDVGGGWMAHNFNTNHRAIPIQCCKRCGGKRIQPNSISSPLSWRFPSSKLFSVAAWSAVFTSATHPPKEECKRIWRSHNGIATELGTWSYSVWLLV